MTSKITRGFGRLFINEDGLNLTFGFEDEGVTITIVDDQEGQAVDVLLSERETQELVDYLKENGVADSDRLDDLDYAYNRGQDDAETDAYDSGYEDGYDVGYADGSDEALSQGDKRVD